MIISITETFLYWACVWPGLLQTSLQHTGSKLAKTSFKDIFRQWLQITQFLYIQYLKNTEEYWRHENVTKQLQKQICNQSAYCSQIDSNTTTHRYMQVEPRESLLCHDMNMLPTVLYCTYFIYWKIRSDTKAIKNTTNETSNEI